MPRLNLSGLSQPMRRAQGALTRAAAIVTVLAGVGAVQTPAPARADSLSGLYLAAQHAEALPDYTAAANFYRRALLRAPEMPELMAPALEYTILSGRIERAPAIAARLVETDPRNRFALLSLIADDLKREQYESAGERLRNAPENALTQYTVTLVGAWAALGTGDRATAEAMLDAAVDDERLSVFAAYHRGLMALLNGDAEKAIESFETTRAAGGRLNPRLAVAYGAAYERAGRAEEAEALYREVLAEESADPLMLAAVKRLERGDPAPLVVDTPLAGAAEALHGLGAALNQNQRGARRSALVYAQLSLFLEPVYAPAQILVASLLDDLDQHEAAAEMFGRVDPSHPSYSAAQLGRAWALARLDRMDEALAELEALARGGDAEANVYITLANLQSGQSLFEECAENYSAALERVSPITDRHWEIFYRRGICNERIGAWEQAEADFERALEMRPDQPDVLNYLGYSLVEQGRRLAEARDMIERAVAARPESGFIVDSLGWLLYRLGDYEGAVTELERAVALTPVEPVINDHFGDALWMVGRRMEARFQWKRSLSFDPEEKDRARIERKLEVGLDAVLSEEAAAQDDVSQDDNGAAVAPTPSNPAQGG